MTFEEAKKSEAGCHWCCDQWVPYGIDLCSPCHYGHMEQPNYSYAKALEYAKRMGLRTDFPL